VLQKARHEKMTAYLATLYTGWVVKQKAVNEVRVNDT
jgi:hypothetical protein